MKDYEKAMAPINQLSEAIVEVEEISNNIPEDKPFDWTEEDWTTLRYGPPEGDRAKYVELLGKWILALGLPIAGTIIGSTLGQPITGTVAGAAIAPELPINETLEYMDEETRAVFETAMANNAFIATLAGIGVYGTDLDKLVNPTVGAGSGGDLMTPQKKAKVEKLKKEIDGGKPTKISSKIWNFIRGAGAYALKNPKKVIAGSIGALALWEINFGDDQDTTQQTDDRPIEEAYTEEEDRPSVEERKAAEKAAKEDKEKFELEEVDEDSGLMSGDEFARAYGWTEIGKSKEEFTIVPPAQTLSDGEFHGFGYGGGVYQGKKKYVGPGDLDTTPQVFYPGSKINNKALDNLISLGGVRMNWMEYIGLVAFNYDLPPELLYGMINTETAGTWDPESHNDDGEDSWGLAQINMDSFGEGTENPSWHIPGGHAFVTPEMAMDPRYAIEFLAHNVRRIADSNGGNIIAGVIGHRGGGKAASYYTNNDEFMTQNDSDYVTKSLATANTIGYTAPEKFKVSGIGVKREWDPFNPTPTEAVNLYVDSMVESMLGVKATQDDYDEWGPKFLEAEKNVYNATQSLKDEDKDYKGLTVGQKLHQDMKETGEYKFADEKQNYQTVQDWFSREVLPTLGDLT